MSERYTQAEQSLMSPALIGTPTIDRSPQRRAEDELFLRLSTTIMTADNRRQVFSLAEHNIDWQRMVSLACAHGTFILVCQNLKDIAPELMGSVAILQNLENQRAVVALKNRQLAEELLKISSDFGAHNIEIIPYKGPVLALQAYGALDVRPFVDLDIIVARSQVADAQRLLFDFGYRPAPRTIGEVTMDLACSDIFQRLTFENTFVRPAQSRTQPVCQIDVHWEVAPPHTLSFDFDFLLRNCIEIELCGQKIRSLKPELMLIVLCAHGTKHKWTEMKWIVDVVELLRRNPELDWDEVYRIAARNRIAKKIDLALLICVAAFGTEIPKTIAEKIQKEGPLISLGARIMRCWFFEVMVDNLRNSWRVEMLTSDSALKCCTFLAHDLIQPSVPTYLKFPLPENLFPLYYFIHPALTVHNFIGARLRAGKPDNCKT